MCVFSHSWMSSSSRRWTFIAESFCLLNDLLLPFLSILYASCPIFFIFIWHWWMCAWIIVWSEIPFFPHHFFKLSLCICRRFLLASSICILLEAEINFLSATRCQGQIKLGRRWVNGARCWEVRCSWKLNQQINTVWKATNAATFRASQAGWLPPQLDM